MSNTGYNFFEKMMFKIYFLLLVVVFFFVHLLFFIFGTSKLLVAYDDCSIQVKT